MEAADYLYGVTMEEPGVSALVSVSLEREAPPAARTVEPGSEKRRARALAVAG
jgi:hypothetical protein